MFRNLTRTALVLAALVSLIAALGPAPAAPASPSGDKAPPEPSVWMVQKRTATHNILDALTKADFDAIRVNATAMLDVAALEKFMRADHPGYRDLMGDFSYANKALVLAAREKNLDGATVAYVQLTISCVNCHKIVRDTGK